MSKKNFLLKEYLTTARPSYVEHSREAEIALIFCEGSVAGVCCIPKVHQRNQVKGK